MSVIRSRQFRSGPAGRSARLDRVPRQSIPAVVDGLLERFDLVDAACRRVSTYSGGTAYIDYVVPGVILLCTGFGAASTAISVTKDMTEGIVARNLVSTALVVAVACLLGFSPAGRADTRKRSGIPRRERALTRV